MLFEGDGKMHAIEGKIDLEHSHLISLLAELSKEEYIVVFGGYSNGGGYVSDGPYLDFGYTSAEAKITLKGSKYLREEIKFSYLWST